MIAFILFTSFFQAAEFDIFFINSCYDCEELEMEVYHSDELVLKNKLTEFE